MIDFLNRKVAVKIESKTDYDNIHFFLKNRQGCYVEPLKSFPKYNDYDYWENKGYAVALKQNGEITIDFITYDQVKAEGLIIITGNEFFYWDYYNSPKDIIDRHIIMARTYKYWLAAVSTYAIIGTFLFLYLFTNIL